jgi:hypothetical protein
LDLDSKWEVDLKKVNKLNVILGNGKGSKHALNGSMFKKKSIL